MPLQNALPSIIKSVQTGSTSINAARTPQMQPITAVNLAKSVLLCNGLNVGGYASLSFRLTSATTIELQHEVALTVINWTVIEYA